MSVNKYSDATRMRRVLKRIAAVLLGHYRVNRICRLSRASLPLPSPPGVTVRAVDDLKSIAANPLFLERSWYGGDDARGFGLFENDELACLCWFWGPRRFNDPLLWALKENEAILVDLLTAPNFRGRDFAPLLISLASREMQSLGRRVLYTWMWHTHRASLRAFEKAGWRQVALVAEINPFRRNRPLRFQWLMRDENGAH